MRCGSILEITFSVYPQIVSEIVENHEYQMARAEKEKKEEEDDDDETESSEDETDDENAEGQYRSGFTLMGILIMNPCP